jgi:hypothetical protein
MRTFFINTVLFVLASVCHCKHAFAQPTRTYYLEDMDRASITWVDTIQQVLRLQRAEVHRQQSQPQPSTMTTAF